MVIEINYLMRVGQNESINCSPAYHYLGDLEIPYSVRR